MPELLLNAEIPADVPDWIMIARTGTWRGHPRGPEIITPERLRSALDYFVRHFAANSTDLVIDYHHATVAVPMLAQRAPAAGWIQEMELRAGGEELWARVLWTTEARNSIGEREYRYVSPAFGFDRPDRLTGEPVPMRIDHVALTNTPFMTELMALNATSGPTDGAADDVSSGGGKSMQLLSLIAAALALEPEQVASRLGLGEAQDDKAVAEAIMAQFAAPVEEEEEAQETVPESVANALGVQPDADETAVMAALFKLRAGAGLAAVRAKLGLAADSTEGEVLNAIGGLQDVHRMSEAEELVETAVTAGKIPPAQRDFWLNAAEQNLDAARAAIAELQPVLNAATDFSGRSTAKEPRLSDTDRHVAEVLGIDEGGFASFLAKERR